LLQLTQCRHVCMILSISLYRYTLFQLFCGRRGRHALRLQFAAFVCLLTRTYREVTGGFS